MPNTSASGGYLTPTTAPVSDAALDAFLQSIVVGVTGLPINFVRPRIQPGTPKQPEPTVDWCAIAVSTFDSADYPVEIHDGTGNGSDDQIRWERLMVLAGFYGPNSNGYARLLRDGLYVPQNREAMQAQGIDVIDAGPVTNASYFLNQQQIRRHDVPFRLSARVSREFPILNLLSAPSAILTN